MAKVCAVTNKRSRVGGGYSNRTRATQYNPTGKVRRQPNLHTKRIYIPEIKKTLSLTLSAKGWKTVNRKGAYKTLKEANLI